MVPLNLKMRDLSRLSPAQNKKIDVKKATPILVILIVVIVLFFAKSRLFSNSGSSAAMILRDAPGGLTPVDGGNSPISTGGVNLTTQSATFKDVKFGGDATATATRSFGGGTYILNVDATLPDPKNTFYEVWLVGPTGVVPIDFMIGSGTHWSLSLRDTDKFSNYKGIWITLKRTKDQNPEEHVLEGSF